MNKKHLAMIAMVLNEKNINVSLVLISFVCDPTRFLVRWIVIVNYTLVHN
jgi:hypothetical protein